MQSFLAYRRLGQAVRKQTQEDEEKAVSPHDENTNESEQGSRHTHPEEEQNYRGLQILKSKEAGTPSLVPPHEDVDLYDLHEALSAHRNTTREADRPAFGHALDGVNVRDRTTREGKNGQVFVVGWNGDADSFNPHNFSQIKKARTVFTVALVGLAVSMASSIDTAVLPQAADEFGVSAVVESLATATFLLGFGLGSLYAGPLSETFGRNPIYIGTLLLFIIWEMASALSPNIGAQITFRFLAGISASPALSVSGGTVADLYDPLEKTFGLPLFAIPAFSGSMLGPIIAAYIGPSPYLSWRWADWIAMIVGGVLLIVIILFQPETYAPIILKWRAMHLRKITGDERFRSELEIVDQTFWHRIKVAMTRPFLLVTEPIVFLMTLYFTVFYIILFTFFVGYPNIFSDVYGTSQGLTNIIFVAMLVGVLLAIVLVPILFFRTKKHLEERQRSGLAGIAPEQRLWYAMLGGSVSLPISLFWMGWTDFVSSP